MNQGKKKKSVIKKIVKTILITVCVFILAFAAVDTYLIVQPQINAMKEISDISDYALTPEDELIGRDVKVIGLGEATHGNKEFQEIKLEVLKNLVSNHGVRALCFEMDYGAGVIINDYINGHSDLTIDEVFDHIAFEIYHTKDIKNLIEWMKDYNDSSTDEKLSFYGFDLQNPETDLFVIENFASDNGILQEFNIAENFDSFLNGEFFVSDERMNKIYDTLENVQKELTDNKDKYEDLYNYERVMMCINNVFKTKELAAAFVDPVKGGELRDAEMADNVIQISKQEVFPIMITGHNGHIGYAGSYVKTMGAHIKEELGDDYFTIGTDYWKTNCNIAGNNERKNHKFVSADILAYQAKRLGTYYLKFDGIDESSDLYTYIHNPIYTGSLGESYSILNRINPKSVRIYCEPDQMYDAMIFVYEATPLEML